jgi:hypothetical protein
MLRLRSVQVLSGVVGTFLSSISVLTPYFAILGLCHVAFSERYVVHHTNWPIAVSFDTDVLVLLTIYALFQCRATAISYWHQSRHLPNSKLSFVRSQYDDCNRWHYMHVAQYFISGWNHRYGKKFRQFISLLSITVRQMVIIILNEHKTYQQRK